MMSKYVEIKLFKYLAVFFTITMLLHMCRLIYFKSQGYYENLGWYDLFVYTVFLKWLFVLVFMFFISNLVKWMIAIKMKWIYRIAIHVILSIVMFFFVFALGSTYIYTFGHFNLENALANVSFRKYMSEIEEIFLIYFTLLGVIHGYFYLKKIKNIKAQESQIQIDLMNSRLNILKSQLQPIFIFNTLNSISTLIEENEEKSQNLIADFGELFREIIDSKDENLIPLKKEWEFLNKFINIAKVRYPKDIDLRLIQSEEIEDVLVPSLILQPLVEYGIDFYSLNVETHLALTVNVCKVDRDRLRIYIQTKGQFKAHFNVDPTKDNTALKNVEDRLSVLYNDNFEFSVVRDEDAVVQIIIIPLVYG